MSKRGEAREGVSKISLSYSGDWRRNNPDFITSSPSGKTETGRKAGSSSETEE